MVCMDKLKLKSRSYRFLRFPKIFVTGRPGVACVVYIARLGVLLKMFDTISTHSAFEMRVDCSLTII